MPGVLGIVRGTQESCRDGPVTRIVTWICRCDLLVVDDIGILAADHDAAEAFCLLIDRRSAAVTSAASDYVCPVNDVWPGKRMTCRGTRCRRPGLVSVHGVLAVDDRRE
jgi:hypothetical protein